MSSKQINAARYTFVAGLHGNELSPYFALQSLGYPVLLGNPKAAHHQRRFTEYDLNAAFLCDGDTYEHERARTLLKGIPKDRPVVDLHTFSCNSEPFAVVVDQTQIPLAHRLGIKKVVYMQYDMKHGGALISARPGISVEVGQHGTDTAFERTIEMVQFLERGVPLEQVEVYQALGTLKEQGEYENFSLHRDGFYPVLAGEVAYDHFGLRTKLLGLQ